MTIFLFANNVNTQLAGAISSSATSLTLSSAANLPTSIPAGQVLVITLNDVATRQNFEIIYATAISGATLSGLLRGQEGTAALAWATGDFAYSPPTAGQMGSMGQLGATNTWSGQNTFSNPVTVGAATASGHALQFGQLPGQFSSSLSTNGYKKYPDPNSPSGYFIEQWGTLNITSTGTGVTNATFNLPIAFPNAHLQCLAGYGGNSPTSSLGAISGYAISGTQGEISIYTTGPGTPAVQYRSLGY